MVATEAGELALQGYFSFAPSFVAFRTHQSWLLLFTLHLQKALVLTFLMLNWDFPPRTQGEMGEFCGLVSSFSNQCVHGTQSPQWVLLALYKGFIITPCFFFPKALAVSQMGFKTRASMDLRQTFCCGQLPSTSEPRHECSHHPALIFSYLLMLPPE